MSRTPKMSLPALVGALYFMVSGGPYGLEELAQTVGFGPAVGVLLAVPLVWALPTALMVGELAAALPDEGGYYAWVRRALGPFWGWQEAWLSLTASVFDMAIYPTLFTLYLGRLVPSLGEHPILVGGAMVAVGVVSNLGGARAVGRESQLMALLLLAPFAVLSALAFFGHHVPAPSIPARTPSTPELSAGVLVAMWNYMGWDNASTVAAEVERPQRTYPLAVLIALALIAVAYVVPIAAMRVAGVDPSAWETGSWVDAARTFGGAPLATLLVAGGMVSAYGMFSALCMSYSRVPAVLAEDGYLPRIFARRHPRTGAPWVSIVACAAAWTASLGLSFDRLVSLDILLYGTSLVLEFVALGVLRLREPTLARPFRVPGGAWGAWLCGLGPVLLLGFALVKNARETIGNVNALAFGCAVMALGPALYVVTISLKKR